ncbi:3-methyl-2-oxobutanoate hydroxymethyltransferase [Thiohalobacter sp. IOR34]|uniref:3-methyl-2-oxobutanoate hydroxymethyltransferase n=1 Tax=Thiohalobacter sp. IOR34 TaxID=3057176 RepID=UPI00339D54B5
MEAVTPAALRAMKRAGRRIACLTAYDASFGHWLDAAGVEVALVGDSLGMVVQGHDSTRPVTMDDMVYHAACVARGVRRALRVVDLPYRSYQEPQQALDNACRLMDEGRAQVVKLEGGGPVVEIVRHLTARGVPVCGHLGLLPQSVEEPGGYRVQGREPAAAQRMLEDARALQAAGADLLVLECIPSTLAGEIRRSLQIPVIGIGAGADCDGQVLVLYDILGITPGRRPRFSEDFLAATGSVPAAIEAYVAAVRDGRFPGPGHSFD